MQQKNQFICQVPGPWHISRSLAYLMAINSLLAFGELVLLRIVKIVFYHFVTTWKT